MKPKDLYRGIVLGYKELQNIDWYNSDIKVHYEPEIDKYGRKIVSDGNEYGVYMTDNLDMALSAYGNPRSNGTPLENSPQLNISGARSTVNVPSVGIVYHINTEGLDIREPFICDELQGHYNNGFQGTEWIADSIPKENVEVIEVKIARDLLHGEQTLTNELNGSFQEQIDQVVSDRTQRLQDFSNELEKLSDFKRMHLTSADMDQYKQIFGENGFKYVDVENMKVQNAQDVLTYMSATVCQKPEIDMSVLKEINKVGKGLTEMNEISDVHDALTKRLNELNDKKIEREQSGLNVEGFVKSIQSVEELFVVYENCINGQCLSFDNSEYEQEIDVGMLFEDQEIDIEELCNDCQEIDIDSLGIEQEPEIDLDSLVNGDLGDMDVELDLGDVGNLSDFVREIGE